MVVVVAFFVFVVFSSYVRRVDEIEAFYTHHTTTYVRHVSF